MSQGTESIAGHQTTYLRESQELDIIAAKKGQPSVMKISYLEDWQRMTIQLANEEPEISEEISPLQARSLLWKKSGTTWKAELVGSKPTPEQTEAIHKITDPWPVDFVPAHAISVGDSWVVSGEALSRMTGLELTNMQGELKAYFEQVIERDGVKCAMISIQIDISGALPAEPGQTVTTTLAVEGHVYRSLSDKYDLATSLSGTITTIILQDVPGESRLRISSQGPVTISETATKNSY